MINLPLFLKDTKASRNDFTVAYPEKEGISMSRKIPFILESFFAFSMVAMISCKPNKSSPLMD